jgi:hypothetical protein
LDAEELEGAARVAFRWLATFSNIHLNVSRPFARGQFDSADEFWVELRDRLDAGEAVVLSIRLPGREHWSVPRSIKGGKLILHDSGGIPSLPLWKFKLGKGDYRNALGHIGDQVVCNLAKGGHAPSGSSFFDRIFAPGQRIAEAFSLNPCGGQLDPICRSQPRLPSFPAVVPDENP